MLKISSNVNPMAVLIHHVSTIRATDGLRTYRKTLGRIDSHANTLLCRNEIDEIDCSSFWVGCGYRAPHRPRTSKGRQDNFPSPKYFRFLFKGNLMFLKYTIRRISYIAIQTIKLCTYIHLLNTNPTFPPSPFPGLD